jgi:DNA end-binding protein Ku
MRPMAQRPVASATISFGLLSIPVKLYTSTNSSESISFRMLHETCKSPLKYQYHCPVDNQVVSRDQIVKGYEYAKDQYVVVTEDEFKALEEAATRAIAIEEFIPLTAIDGVYFDKAYYVAPDKGGARAYRLLAKALLQEGLGGLARYAVRGKAYLVVLRAVEDGLIMQQLLYAHEVRPMSEVPIEDGGQIKDAEFKLALQLIHQLKADEFRPDAYHDDVHVRMKEFIQQKVDGQEIVIPAAESPRAQVIDLMEALKASLGGGAGKSTGDAAKTKSGATERKPAKASPAKKTAKKSKKAAG